LEQHEFKAALIEAIGSAALKAEKLGDELGVQNQEPG
jgi:hypothetical protein